ncbi:MAG: DNA repair protein RecN [Paramuribaculum sp.]|nr:DNA repair protein RecN [Paramuribaculum sp.]
MLETLHISNYALIDTVDIRFYEGFDIITGETGAGKSIILGALSLLLGGRADTKAVRQSDRKSVIEAVFMVADYPSIKDFCEANDIDWDDTRCILRREISPNGRSRAFINDTPVPLARLHEVALQLVDIHSQHQNQLLSQPEFQLKVIDTLAANDKLMRDYSVKFNSFRETLRKLKIARQHFAKTRDDEEYMRYQLDQLDQLNPQPGEVEELERDRDVLSNLTDIKSNLYTALQALTDAPSNMLSLLEEVTEACTELEPVIHESDNIPSRLETLSIEIADISQTLSAIDQELAADPRELDAMEERLQALYAMMEKHKVGTVEELIAVREKLRSRLNRLENADETLAELEKETRRALALAKETAGEITERRKKAAQEFAGKLKELAVPLGMKNLCCEIKVDPTEISATGMDRIEFTFAFNKNQPLMPVGGAASGGEISRLMLCIKAIIAEKMKLPSIIFDEVDTGVSGDVANRIGEMMAQIGRSIQVIAITHLPQVAAKGAHHFKVYKEDDDNATHTRINELTPQARVGELALMLSGNPDDKAARANAESLLAAAGNI